MQLPSTTAGRRELFKKLAFTQFAIFFVSTIAGLYGVLSHQRGFVLIGVAVMAISLVLSPITAALPMIARKKRAK